MFKFLGFWAGKGYTWFLRLYWPRMYKQYDSTRHSHTGYSLEVHAMVDHNFVGNGNNKEDRPLHRKPFHPVYLGFAQWRHAWAYAWHAKADHVDSFINFAKTHVKTNKWTREKEGGFLELLKHEFLKKSFNHECTFVSWPFQVITFGWMQQGLFFSKHYPLFMKVISKLRVLQLLCGMCMYR